MIAIMRPTLRLVFSLSLLGLLLALTLLFYPNLAGSLEFSGDGLFNALLCICREYVS